MNYRHTYLVRNALKLTYSNLAFQKMSGGVPLDPSPGETASNAAGERAFNAEEGEGEDRAGKEDREGRGEI